VTALYRVLLRTAFLGQIQYRASGVIWMIGSILEPLVFLVVWTTVAEARGDEVAGFGARDFAAYYITMLVVNHLTFSWIMHTFQYRVQQGQLSFELLRPMHPIHSDLTDNLSYKALMLVVVAPAVALMVWGFEPRFAFEAWSLAAFLPVLLLAFAVRFLFEWTLALLAFWTTRVLAINQIYFVVMMFLSGRIAPLAVFPGWLQDTAAALPFYYMVAFPVELLLGRLAPETVLRGAAVQLVWLAVAGATIAAVWRLALRRFTAVGS
jgi:ABC-2 type transport system permease protein